MVGKGLPFDLFVLTPVLHTEARRSRWFVFYLQRCWLYLGNGVISAGGFHVHLPLLRNLKSEDEDILAILYIIHSAAYYYIVGILCSILTVLQ